MITDEALRSEWTVISDFCAGERKNSYWFIWKRLLSGMGSMTAFM